MYMCGFNYTIHIILENELFFILIPIYVCTCVLNDPHVAQIKKYICSVMFLKD